MRKIFFKLLLTIVLLGDILYGGLTKTEVSELYVALFNRASEGEGNNYWQKTQYDLVKTADIMLNTNDSKEYFGSSLDTNQAFIEHIYRNTLNKTIDDDPEGIEYWTNQLNSGKSRAEVVIALIEALKTYKNSVGKTKEAYNQFINRVEISNYMADRVYKAPSDYKTSTSFDNELKVTFDNSTVANAKKIIDRLTNDTNSNSQQKGLGALIPTEEMLESIPVALPPLSSYSANDLPSSFDLSDKMPPVRHQGNQGSCVSWAVGYYLKGYHEHINKKTEYGGDNHSGEYSPAFLYNVLKNGSSCDGGTYISQNLERVKNVGIASWKDMPYKDSDCNSKPSPKARNSAKCAKILDYQRIRTHRPIEKVEMQDIKYFISHGNPIVIGMKVYSGFNNPKMVNGEFFYKDYNENGYRGGHAIVVVGYDDSKNAFKIINSWGKGWGNNGFLWIDYNVFSKVVFVAYRTTDADEGCEDSGINIAPIADAEVEVDGKSVKFDASKSYDSDGNIVSYQWFLGETLLSSKKTFTKDNFNAGKYSITLKVTDNNGASSTKTITVNIEQSDNNYNKDYFITIWKTDNQGTSANNQITIPTNSNYKYNYNIDWGDGKITNGVTGDITHTYSKRGKYTIKIWGEFPSIYLGKNADFNITTVNNLKC